MNEEIFWTGILPVTISLVALFFSLLVTWLTQIRKQKRTQIDGVQTSIDNLYDEFHRFNSIRLSNPELSHLFETVGHYESVSRFAKKAAGRLGAKNRSALLLQERAIAIMVFSMYENLLFFFGTAEEDGNIQQAKFLSAVLDYLEKSWLPNPRLKHFWCDDRHALRLMFEPATVDRFKRNVLDVSGVDSDPIGPFDEAKA